MLPAPPLFECASIRRPVRRVHLHVAVVVRREADEDAGARAGEPVERLPGVLERLLRDLEQQPVLRIDPARLARRDAEEGGVEAVDVVDEAAPAAVHRPFVRGVGVEEAVEVEALGRNLADRVDAVAQQRPEALGRVGAAGKPAADADDRSCAATHSCPPGPTATQRLLGARGDLARTASTSRSSHEALQLSTTFPSGREWRLGATLRAMCMSGGSTSTTVPRTLPLGLSYRLTSVPARGAWAIRFTGAGTPLRTSPSAPCWQGYVDARPESLLFTRVCAWCGDETHGKPALVQHGGRTGRVQPQPRGPRRPDRGGAGSRRRCRRRARRPGGGLAARRDDGVLAPRSGSNFSSDAEPRTPLATATLWCRKEAAAKAVGRGLAADLGGIGLGAATTAGWRTALVPAASGGRASVRLLVRDVPAGPESVAALAVAASEAPTVLVRDWDWSRLY